LYIAIRKKPNRTTTASTIQPMSFHLDADSKGTVAYEAGPRNDGA
jgi:hypothetical protein